MDNQREQRRQQLNRKHEQYMNTLKSDQRNKIFSIPWQNGDNYIAVGKLGQGGFSAVFKCINTNNSQFCAIKMLKREFWLCAKKQIEILIHLNGKCGFIPLLDTVKVQNCYCLVFQYVELTPFYMVLQTLNSFQTKFYLYQLLLSLYYCHSNSIMHRDLNPSNIAFDLSKKKLKILDLGLADYYIPGNDYETETGTFHYLSPECFLHHSKQTCAIDIWGFGLIMASMILGKDPFFSGRSITELFQGMIGILGNIQLSAMIRKYKLMPEYQLLKLLETPELPMPVSFFASKNNQKYATPLAIDLLLQTLRFDPAKRLTALQCIRHSYFDQIRQYASKQLKQQHEACGILEQLNFQNFTYSLLENPQINQDLSRDCPNGFKFVRSAVNLEIKYKRFRMNNPYKILLQSENGYALQQQNNIQIKINGGMFESGGQIIRTSISLSQILNRPFYCYQIRKRSVVSPGINLLLKTLLKSFTQKQYDEGLSQIIYHPSIKKVIHFKGNQQTSATLLMQTALPICVIKNYKQTIIEGMIYMKYTPILTSLQHIIVPLLQQIGIKIKLNIKLGQLYDRMKISIQTQNKHLKPLILNQFTGPKILYIFHIVSDKFKGQTFKQVQSRILNVLEEYGYGDIRVKQETIVVKKGNIKYQVTAILKGQNLYWDLGVQQKFASFGNSKMITRLRKLLEYKFCVDHLTMDQILIFLALAKGKSIIKSQTSSGHIKGLRYLIPIFLPIVQINRKGDSIEISGAGIQIQ